MARRYYSSTAARTTLASGVDGSTVTLSVTAVSGWPTQYPYTLIIDKDTVNEELVSVSARSGTTLTVTRGVDGTSGTAHNAGATVEHGVSARDFDEPNDHVNDTTSAHGLTIANVVTLAGTQTLTNKTITGGTVNPTTLQQGGVQAVTTTDTQTLTNKTITAPISTVATNPQTASYTLVLGDASKIVEVSNAAGTTLTIPTNASVAFPVGTQIVVLQTGAGQVTVAGAAGVTVNGTPGLKLRAQWSVATLIKRATNTWVVAGDVVA